MERGFLFRRAWDAVTGVILMAGLYALVMGMQDAVQALGAAMPS